MDNLVSIITPSYNSADYISETIESVLQQSYAHWEMIIVDDASQDDSITIIDKFIQQDSRIKLIKLSDNAGPAFARNQAIKAAQGKYIAFLDSDDVWKKSFLEKSVTFLSENSYQLGFSSYDRCDENLDYTSTVMVPKKISYHDLLKSNHIACLTGIYDAEACGKFYMDEMGHEDYTMWLKIIKVTKFAYSFEEPLAKYRVRKKSVSSNKFNLKNASWQWNIYRKNEQLNILTSSYYFLWYIFNAVKKRIGN